MNKEKLVDVNWIERDIMDSVARGQKIITRYPPEPNGYMHIGHAKAFYLDHSLSRKYGGRVNLRFDDTNPEKEDMRYVTAMQRDIKWLGLDWDELLFASDYYEQLYEMAQALIKKGLAYVDFSTPDELKSQRGSLTQPGIESKYRNTPIDVNLAEFAKMRAGNYPDGHCVLRAKIDMSSGNMNMRDPVIYRIMRVPHYRTGTDWLIYPLYDFAHPLSDAIEGISHSICSLEYDDHRPLYDWFIENAFPKGQNSGAGVTPAPRQFEFSRLNIEQTIMSKRYLKVLVDEGVVDGWDDPRMPTISGMRRRGYPPQAIMDFVASTGVSRTPMTVPLSALEFYVRQHLDKSAPRISVVFNPLKIRIKRLDATIEEFFIERDDFSENPPAGWKRLTVGGVVRLREFINIKCIAIGFIDCTNPSCHECNYLECIETDEKHVGIIHWVNKNDAIKITVNKFEPLLHKGIALVEENINKDSKKTMWSLAHPDIEKIDGAFQAIRRGFFIRDNDGTYNKIVGLKEGY